MSKLAGKIAVITGADSGMGKAMAAVFAREGAHVAITYHSDQQGAQDTLEQVRNAGGRGLVRQVDVRDEHSVSALFKAYFVDTRDIGDHEVLADIADGIGMDAKAW